jgi:hypothetical protein
MGENGVCGMGYYGVDSCKLEITDSQKELLGLSGKSDEELGLGNSCINQDKIINLFTEE